MPLPTSPFAMLVRLQLLLSLDNMALLLAVTDPPMDLRHGAGSQRQQKRCKLGTSDLELHRCWTSAVETDGIYSGLPGERDATSVSCCGIMTSHNWLRQFLRSAEVAMFKLGRPLINCLTFPFYSRRFAPVEEYYGWSRTKFQWGPQDVQMFQPDFRVTSGEV
ncbi:hypothetical protein AK812_SmicGene5562 [Symbiodinium microadriaticum]|uniref:Uncharacterized protein n=1 Tax=Symbiodinium microadriaticum TaxID=2951 RepID=A0A1Q9ETI1_SYMMI|nr:hypothetical protein AK812_SmicGene5562 [Symbiodinium microadriaticum]